jgi:hypothetical protein
MNRKVTTAGFVSHDGAARTRISRSVRRARPSRLSYRVSNGDGIQQLWGLHPSNYRRLEAGQYKDYADVVRRHRLTRARLTRLMKILLLALGSSPTAPDGNGMCPERTRPTPTGPR